MSAILVHSRLFGGPLRFGDQIAACNFLANLRLQTNQPDLQLYIPDESIFPAEHCFFFRRWLQDNTDYVALEPDNLITLEVTPGTDPTYSDMFNLFNIRKDVLIRRQNIFDIEDLVTLPNLIPQKRKIVICPMFDADYNFSRNWTLEYTQKIINGFNYYYESPNTDMVIICKKPMIGLDIKHFSYSHNFEQNLKHVQECQRYIGPDTGFSHFAGALEPGPVNHFYHYPKDTYGTVLPMRWKVKNRHITYY